MLFRTTLLATLAVAGVSVGAHATTYNLSGSTGATPTFSITSGGNTATFTSPAGNAFAVQDTTGLLSFSTALLDSNFFSGDALTITFATPVTNEILIPFAILNSYSTTDALKVTAGAGTVRTFAASPDSLSLGEPEGVIAFVPTNPLTTLTLVSVNASNAFAIGNITVPEPMSLSLLGMGLAGMAALRRKKRTV
jgi:hypothetical protein